MVKAWYGRRMNAWEMDLATRSNDRMVRPFDWGLDWTAGWPVHSDEAGPEKRIRELAATTKAFVVPELNLGQMVREVERAANGKARTFAVPHAGGSVHRPEDILKVIVEASR